MEHSKARACIESSEIIARTTDPDAACDQIISSLRGRLGYERSAVILKRLATGRPHVFAHCRSGYELNNDAYLNEIDRINRLISNRNNGVVHAVLESGSEIVANDVSRHNNYIAAAETIQSEACFPLITNNQCIGVFNVESNCLNAFDEIDTLLMKALCTQLSLHLDRARLQQFLGITQFSPRLSA